MIKCEWNGGRKGKYLAPEIYVSGFVAERGFFVSSGDMGFDDADGDDEFMDI